MFTEHTENQKYIDYLQPLNQNVYALIQSRMESLDSNWYKRKILDYGCNNGHLLRTSQGKILQENYIGIDVQTKPLDQARIDFPNAQFIHYNGYHASFNPTGQKEFPKLDNFKPEIIVCHGVFTHCDITSILETLDYFKSIIMPNGYIIFSMWEDFHLSKYIDIFLEDRLKITVPKNIANLTYENSFYLINRNDALIDQEKLILEQCDWIETFYRREYIKRKIPNLLIPEGLKSKHTIFVLPK